jgi:acylphosphatase
MPELSVVIAKRAFVSGRVQGVGFRYTTADRARGLGLDGWVRNLHDGRVEVFVQGDEATLDVFLSWLELGPSAAEVTEVAIRNAPPRRGFVGFEIKH